MSSPVFLSRPTALSKRQRSTFCSWSLALEQRGLELRALSRNEYVPDPWASLRERLGAVEGVVIFGFRQLEAVTRAFCSDTFDQREPPTALASTWTQIEAGLAISADLPVLALAERGVSDGVFDPATWGTQVIGHELSEVPAQRALDELFLAIQKRHRSLSSAVTSLGGPVRAQAALLA